MCIVNHFIFYWKETMGANRMNSTKYKVFQYYLLVMKDLNIPLEEAVISWMIHIQEKGFLYDLI